MKEKKTMSRGRTCLKDITKNGGSVVWVKDPEWAENFFHLLLEIVQVWALKGASMILAVGEDYKNLYNQLISEGVNFPDEKKFIDWPKSHKSEVASKKAQSNITEGTSPKPIKQNDIEEQKNNDNGFPVEKNSDKQLDSMQEHPIVIELIKSK